MTAGYETITPEELRYFTASHDEADYEIIDVREPAEYRQGHVPGARHIPVGEVEARLDELVPGRTHIFYCRSGARSRAALTFAVESGLTFGPLYDLAGGILAWDGHTVPDEPRLATFATVSDMRSLLLRAIDMEKAVHGLYTRVREASGRPVVCDLMDRLVGVEVAHARVIYRELRKWWAAADGQLPPFETLFETLEGRVLEGGRSVDELEPWIRSASTGDCHEVADLALELEFAAYDLYRNLADEAVQGSGLGEDAGRVFLDLASQEKAHARMIVAAIARFGEEGADATT